MTKRPTYSEALYWLVWNDDNSWIDDPNCQTDDDQTLSVTASLVADLFGKTDQQLAKDLRKELQKKAA